MLLTGALGLLLGCGATQPARGADLCAAASAKIGAQTCVQSANGIVLSSDPACARKLLENAEAGVVRFKQRFGKTPNRYAVVEVSDGRVEGDVFEGLRAAGFSAVLPWLSVEGYRAQIEQSVRRAVEPQVAHLPPEAREATVQEAIAKVAGKNPAGGQEAGAVPHELGHIWYAQAYWPDSKSDGGHYGGAGPDWMDETAAVLMESPELAALRVSQFAERYRALRAANGLNKKPENALVDLAAFFASTHPGAERGRAMLAQLRQENPGALPQNGMLVRASSGPEAERFAEAAIHYYLQATLAAEYLVKRSGDPAIFASIGAAFGRGETIEQWLAGPGAAARLPNSVAALQADWLAWLEQRFPEPAKQ